MDSCDVIIVGGGPAGSTLAWKLKNGGLDVVVIDKSVFPRDKVCAGWVTPGVTDLLELDRDNYSRGRVLQDISGFRTSMIGGEEVLTRYGNTVSYGIRRFEFDDYLLRRSGARLRLGEPLRTMKQEKGSWIVNGEVKTPLLIGAGGHFCPVGRSLRGCADPESKAVVVAQEVEFEMDESQKNECRVSGDTPELFFCEDFKGYGWCVRKMNYLNVGFGREDHHDAAGHVRSFFEYLKERKRIPANTPASFKGHAYRLYQGASSDLIDDGVMLIGDAAGLAYPKSGEGIRPAVESALAAADVILAASGDYRQSRLHHYPARLSARFGKGGSGTGIMPQAAKRFMGRMLMKSSWFSRHVLLDRWFLNA